jgi:hypothetical protein
MYEKKKNSINYKHVYGIGTQWGIEKNGKIQLEPNEFPFPFFDH